MCRYGCTMTLLPAPAEAREKRVGRVVVFGNDPCSRAKDGHEILICGRMPDAAGYAESESVQLGPPGPSCLNMPDEAERTAAPRAEPAGSAAAGTIWHVLAREPAARRSGNGAVAAGVTGGSATFGMIRKRTFPLSVGRVESGPRKPARRRPALLRQSRSASAGRLPRNLRRPSCGRPMFRVCSLCFPLKAAGLRPQPQQALVERRASSAQIAAAWSG